jgi:hypothetical protein
MSDVFHSITTSSHHDEFAIARETGAAHGEHLLHILESTPEDRKAAIVEGAKIRLGSFISQNSPAGAPGSQILDVAYRAFDTTINHT